MGRLQKNSLTQKDGQVYTVTVSLFFNTLNR